jgi:hypothetical protein
MVETGELNSGRASGGGAIYRFSSALDPLDVTYDGGWALWHHKFEAEGKLNHTLEDCPQFKKPVQVRRWEPKTGWTTIEVPFAASVAPDAHRP